MHYWDDPSWERNNELMKRHHAASAEPGKPALTADERPAVSPRSITYAGAYATVTLTVPGLGAVIIRMREGARSGKLEWLDCRLTSR